MPFVWLNMRSICVPLDQARDLASAIAQGDLTRHVDTEGRDETAAMLTSLQSMQVSLQAAVTQVRQASDSIGTASAEIASGNQYLSSSHRAGGQQPAADRSLQGAADQHGQEQRGCGAPGQPAATWASLGHEEVMRRLGHGSELLPGCADADAAVRFLVQHMLRCSRGQAGVHAFVTHDSLVTATAARFLGAVLTRSDWPWYLEVAFFWDDQGAVQLAYRERRGWRLTPLMGLTEADVIFLARHEVAATVGLDCPARFFLAGGAFKSLLTGRPPRDLDLWAPSSEERAVLETRLIERGAERTCVI